ncbi:MAG: EAL domain-containing protein [Novosphingobium sp.]|nr:EAL domain-containing protein [Novosphingobium sp.]
MKGFRALLSRERAPEAARAPTLFEGLDADDAVNLVGVYESLGRGWFWATDERGNIRYVSESVSASLGIAQSDLIGTPLQALCRSDAAPDEPQTRTLPLVFTAAKSFTGLIVRISRGDGDSWWSLSGRPCFDSEGALNGFYGNGEDVTAMRRERQDASRIATTDPLTGLANRVRMAQLLEQAVKQAQASNRTHALMMIDLDRFKAVNDSMGHQAGDELLQQVAERLTGFLGGKGVVGRLGGDEFQALLPAIDDRGELGELARKIIEVLSQPFTVTEGRCAIGASVGIAVLPYDGEDSETIVGNADLALYAAKEAGKGHYRFYASELHAEAERRRSIENDLHDALHDGQLEMLYQPIVETPTGKVVALEAGIRWNHPELGEVPSTIFLPMADRMNIRLMIDNWAIRQACRDCVSLPGSIAVAFNVSLAQLREQALSEVVASALATSELAPARLELELPEDAFDLAGQALVHELASLHLLGVRMTLDRFGAARCSLAVLRHTPIDAIKLDASLLEQVTTGDERGRAIIDAICAMGQALDVRLMADGVTTLDQIPIVAEAGFDKMQGPAYSRPIPFMEVCDAMATGGWVIEPSGPSRFRSDRRTMFRRVGVIHENCRYDVMMRNLSSTGCLVDGLVGVPVGEQFVVDFGDGQLAVATVRRSADRLVGLQFELPLIDDGAGGLVTRNRVPAAVVAQMQAGAQPDGLSLPRFAQAGDAARKAPVRQTAGRIME